MSTQTRTPPGVVSEPLRARLEQQLQQAIEEHECFPLSFAQQRLWFLDQLQPNSPLYNIPSVARLTGKLDVSALQQALDRIVARHESLRTRFVSHLGQPAQVIDPHAHVTLQCEELQHGPASERQARLEQRIEQETCRPFNLSTDQLLRASLLRLQPEEHVLVLCMHHIVSDEWSYGIFYRELSQFYAALSQGRALELPELPIQYADYAQWQQQWLQGPAYLQQLEFWKEQLRGAPSRSGLPTDWGAGPAPGSEGAAESRHLDAVLSEQLKELAKAQGATLFMLLLAAFKTLLYRYSRQMDIVVGTPVSGRSHLETENLIGFFVNTLPLRTRLSEEASFQQLLAQERETALAAFSHAELPFEKLVEALHPERSLTQTPFISQMFLLQSRQGTPPQLPGLELAFLPSGNGTAKFDLTLAAHESAQGLGLRAEYRSALFEPGTVARLLGSFETLLRGIVAQPTQPLWQLPLLEEPQRRRLLVEWNQTRTDYPRNLCVHELFEAQAAEHPKAIAVLCGREQLSYRELNCRANQLARHLRQAGVKPRGTVGLCLERSLEMLVGMLGILKAGAAYAPLEPGLPRERLTFMLEDLQLSSVVTRSDLAERLTQALPAQSPPRLLCLDTHGETLARHSRETLLSGVHAEDVAYISFTSGSTGRPKGVCLPHRGIVRLVKDSRAFHFGPKEVFLQTGPISFDASLFEIWGALLNGARLVLAPPHLPSLAEYAALMHKHRVTTAWFTTGLFNQLVEHHPEALVHLRQLVTGGDVLSPPHAQKALHYLGQGRLFNGYGPTENGTFSTTYCVPPQLDARRSLPIGRPISNSQCYLLDEHLQPVPIGVPGELYVGGDGLALGYLNRPELTAQRFIPHPFLPGARLYRTGDLARYRNDGNLEFLGRIDGQVKIRGFRVEPGEIEAVLLRHPAVRQCAVTTHTNAAGEKQLAAYIVTHAESGAAASAPAPRRDASHRVPESIGARWNPSLPWEEFLRSHLPDYMLPTWFATLPALPLSPTGKVDRRALPPPQAARSPKDGGGRDPRDETERRLQQLWQNILNVGPLGLRDKFFALGGHSLLAVRLVAEVEKSFGQKLRVSDVFQHPTIEQFARLLRQGKAPRNDSAIVEIKPDGRRAPLFLVHGAGGGMFWGYANLARHLEPEQPVFAFKSRGLDGLAEFTTIETMAEAYLAELRAFQPQGPYYLGGYCFGGVVAYEMARRLQAQRQRVALLALINSGAPNSSYATFQWSPACAGRFALNLSRRLFHFATCPRGKLFGYLRWKGAIVCNRLCGRLQSGAARRLHNNVDDWLDLTQFSTDQRQVWHTHIRALEHYNPQPYTGALNLFRSPVHGLYCSYDPKCGWADYAQAGVCLKLIPGAHETIMEEPGVRRLAAELQRALTQAQLLCAQS